MIRNRSSWSLPMWRITSNRITFVYQKRFPKVESWWSLSYYTMPSIFNETPAMNCGCCAQTWQAQVLVRFVLYSTQLPWDAWKRVSNRELSIISSDVFKKISSNVKTNLLQEISLRYPLPQQPPPPPTSLSPLSLPVRSQSWTNRPPGKHL